MRLRSGEDLGAVPVGEIVDRLSEEVEKRG